MNEEGFREWLGANYRPNTVQTKLSEARQLAKAYGDLDSLYDQDRLESVMESLRYSAADKAQNRSNPSKVPLTSDLYRDLGNLRTTVNYYRRYRGEKTMPKPDVEAVNRAIDECAALGLDTFLDTYGFGKDIDYLVVRDGAHYPSKAVFGVAHQFMPGGTPLDGKNSNGTVARLHLEKLGFQIVDTKDGGGATASFGTLLIDAMARFEQTRLTPYQKHADLWEAMDAVKRRIESYTAVKHHPYVFVDWSLGAGNWLKTPWIALFDNRITTSAQSGIYIVLLVAEDLSRLYITLNQGATEVEKKHGRTGARTVLSTRAEQARKLVPELVQKGFKLDSEVDLKTKQYRSKFYEVGTIAHVEYDLSELPSDKEIERLLEALLSAYERAALTSPSPLSQEPKMVEQSVIRATNLILYGPPGTGKTYRTAEEAVRLCDGLTAPSQRHEIMERYNSLKNAGRIEFVTFHQSFGYEDFVEGLRPQTDVEEGEEDATSGGFRLKPEPGVFKRISALAEQSGSAPSTSDLIDLNGRKFFKMSLGRSADQSEVYQAAIEGGYIALGYGGNTDWSDSKYGKWQAVFDKWRETEPDISPNRGDVVQTYSLRGAMNKGDIVIISDGNTKFRAIGEVTGDYYYDPDADDFRHRRAVKWLRVFDKSLPVDLILDGRFSMMSIHSLNPANIKTQALQSLIGGAGETGEVAGEPEPYVLIIDEINRANVSKVFGELITLLESDKRLGCENALTVTLPYSKEQFGVPANLHIIGTMNTADRSIALLDTALRRRFQFRELMPQPEVLQEASIASGVNLSALLTKLNNRIEYLFDRDHQIGHAYFVSCKSRADVDDVVRFKVIPLLSEYFYENWEKVWQVLGEPDASDEGAFLCRQKLSGPAGAGGEAYGIDRWRFVIKPEFAATAYDQWS